MILFLFLHHPYHQPHPHYQINPLCILIFGYPIFLSMVGMLQQLWTSYKDMGWQVCELLIFEFIIYVLVRVLYALVRYSNLLPFLILNVSISNNINPKCLIIAMMDLCTCLKILYIIHPFSLVVMMHKTCLLLSITNCKSLEDVCVYFCILVVNVVYS